MSQGGSSFDAKEGRAMACVVQSLTQNSINLDYGLGDVGTVYTVYQFSKNLMFYSNK